MWFFNKRQRKLRDFFDGTYTDIHSHLIYGIDDGAATFEDTLSLVTALSEYGFARFTATPHTLQGVWDNSRETIVSKAGETVNLLWSAGFTRPFAHASEYLMDESLIERIGKEKLLTLKDNYVLVEMSYLNPPMQLFDILFELRTAGYQPVLAHPERYTFYHGRIELYEKLKRSGCLFQLNLLSVTGYYGTGVLLAARDLLRRDLIDFTGSDVHHQKHVAAFEGPAQLKKQEEEAFIHAVRRNAFFGS